MSNKKLFKIALVLQLAFLPYSIFGQNKTIDATVHKMVQQRTDHIFDSLIKIRRDFHTYPELSEQEKRTSNKIAEYLTSLGLEVHTNIGGYGVVGILKTNKEGKHIAWRADIDALESKVLDVEAFQSKNKGVSHICGHDVNATIALGIADVLSSLKEKLSGTVYFVFQPSEENLKGAKAMINDGLFDIINPDEIYALHISPMPVGVIGTKSNWLFAGYKSLKVSYKNSSENEDIIAYTKELISSFQNVNPDSKFWDNRNLLDPNIGLGNPNTIYKDYLTVAQKFKIEQIDNQISISTYISSSSENKMDSILSLLKEKIKASKYAKKLVSVAYSSEYPIISNNKELTNKTINSLSNIYGNQSVNSLYGVIPDGRSDDFAYFQQIKPSVYFLLGGSNFEKGIISMPHSPNFTVDESCIKTGVKFFSSIIIERLKQ
ncbi:metal-dependent hydrolase [Bizionia sp. APA-3]|nr:metal-dependent hydrolase [Bizionia sp. APA-3]